MDLGLAGKKAIVCASSRGLGKACAAALAREGCSVIINGRDTNSLQDTVTELNSLPGAAVTGVCADIGTAALRMATPSRRAHRPSPIR